MSTKIYDGMISTDKNTMRLMQGIRATLEPMFYDKFVAAVDKANAHVGEVFQEVFGRPSFSGGHESWTQPIPDEVFGTPELVWDRIIELQKTKTHTFSELDFGYDVSIIPNGRGVTLPPLVLLFSERAGDEYRTALRDAGLVAEYGYWNNTDEPEGMSMTEWRKRERSWTGKSWDGREWWAPGEVDVRVHQPTKINTVYKMISERAGKK